MRQREMAARIVQLSGELDFAKQRHKNLQHEAAAAKEHIIAGKLNPKGHLLLKR